MDAEGIKYLHEKFQINILKTKNSEIKNVVIQH